MHVHLAHIFVYIYKTSYFRLKSNQCKSVKCVSLAYFLTKGIGARIIMGQILMILLY